MTKTVWHICSNRWNSAVTEYALSCATSLKEQGWNTVLTGLEGKAFLRRSENRGLSGYSMPGFRIRNLPRLLNLYRRIKPDLVVVYGGPETFFSKFFRASAVVRFRGLDRDLTSKQRPLAYRLSQGHLSGVICPSELLLDRFSHVEANAITVPLGLDASRFCHQSPRQVVERPTLMVLGRLDPVKGHGGFFLWFRMLLRQWPESIPKPFLRVVGEPANIPVDHIRGFAADVQLEEGQDWELIDHRVKDLPSLMARTHLGVICSQGSEVICRVAEEFLLCGVPIFVSGVGSLESCLYDEKAGSSYRGLPGDQAVKLLQTSLIEAFEETQAQRRGRSLRSRKHFSLEAMGRDLDAYLSQLGPIQVRGFEPSAVLTKP